MDGQGEGYGARVGILSRNPEGTSLYQTLIALFIFVILLLHFGWAIL